VIAAGGICDGRSMAAAFALGAEGVQMGTRMVSALESPVHERWKEAIVAVAETDTVFLNRFSRPGLRALRTERTTALEPGEHVGMELLAPLATCTSVATWRRRSRSEARSWAGSPECDRWPTSSATRCASWSRRWRGFRASLRHSECHA
jgi:NAD(P)H-dependent flavin oxidoreductase YrpB (nitropropane dioxygenase family)